ncbi:SKP1/BTB/POZ domain superfamily [Fusarium oxysporum f. sp. vasinfectum]|nr:SKP1/BTB/POZ domain superfamily [Fusarium oxysporum f. sp. vasinfectum]KAK2922518.1 SKP1/BTB/POZ domain superfamily [Fusarium oxysporum f. sp. vasinfectum]
MHVGGRPDARIATSKPFRFLIGADQTEYTIHSALVAHQSPVLSALVNGLFRESAEFSVKWDDIDEIVFNSFWQFAYIGDYDTPESFPPTAATLSEEEPKSDNSDEPPAAPILDESAEDAPIEEVLAETDEPASDPEAVPEAPPVDIISPPTTKEKEKKRADALKPSLWLDFLLDWDCPSEPSDVDVTLRDCANPLVHHAKVYTLADRYAVTRLMEISRTKLHQSLADLPTSEEANSDVVELVRYAFEELVPDQLRDLVVHYIACVVEHLWKIEEFQELVGKHGSLSKALVGTMLLRFDQGRRQIKRYRMRA